MKGIAYAILIVVASTIILGPLVECFQLVAEKARLDSSINNCGKLAVLVSSQDNSAQNLDAEIDLEKFMDSFNASFENSLNLSLKESNTADLPEEKIATAYFESNDGRYNDFTVNLTVRKDRLDVCEVLVVSKYKFKTKHLVYVEEHVPGFAEFNLERKSKFALELAN
ncbi:hypothetical protein [Acetivibrio cellulolyticus]|uniref:hypothetical protein n=1 Tax=Acetivibrio cellulolyticus TaxID=35830 RepID=UPI0001E2C1BC|nr:hypothetical protein [Acetivibrio cellulolyticus]